MTERRTERIPFEVEVSRIIEVLAKQIYQTPLALLRENAQNAFDAILMRRHHLGAFDAEIVVTIANTAISISDNGIGMTSDDLRTHYWRAGSSGKNNPDARAAGVVGTFGIGAMANFGIADELIVETESALTGERTRSSAQRDSLSTTEDCIEVSPVDPTGSPGTLVRARISTGQVDIDEAVRYITDFIGFVDVPVVVNGTLISRRALVDEVPSPADAADMVASQVETRLSGNLTMRITGAGDVWVHMRDLQFDGQPVPGELVLRQGHNALRTFRSGFGLAVAGVTSHYNFGGAADVAILEPTAGREALTTASLQILQDTVAAIDEAVSLRVAERPEATQNAAFIKWARAHGRYDLCGNLLVRQEPGSRQVPLHSLRELTRDAPLLFYAGSDRSIINASASDDSPLVVLATANPRRICEREYLSRYCETTEITDAPTVLSKKPPGEWSLDEQALVFRIVSILESDYFLSAEVSLGELSHSLPLVALTEEKPVRIVLDPSAPTFGVMRELYGSDLLMFGSMVKDFVRNVVFPRVADLVPSSTRQGADAFLKSIRRTRDVFEYEAEDLENFSRIWEEYLEGTISMGEAAQRSIYVTQQSVQVFEPEATRSVADVVPDVIDAQAVTVEGGLEEVGPSPPILRTEIDTTAKLLTVEEGNDPIYGYRCFIALSDRAREERGEFFLQPHSTAVVWGGQKVLFVFEHHSGEFGLYYDLQASHVVSPESGGGAFPTATMVLRDRIFIPVPDALALAFIPDAEERKRFEVRCDLLYTESGEQSRTVAPGPRSGAG